MRVGVDQARVAGRPGGEELVEPGRDLLEVLVAGGQDAGVGQDVADVVHGLGRGQGIPFSISAPFEMNENRDQLVEPQNCDWNGWFIEQAAASP